MPTSLPRLRAARWNSLSCRKVPDSATLPYSRRSGSPPLSSASSAIGIADWLAAMRSRMSRFHSRRSICQTLNARQSTRIGSEMSVGHRSGLSLTIERSPKKRTAGDRPGGSYYRRLARLVVADRRVAGAPPVDADEEEQPDHVDEVPVPGGGF